MLSHPQYRKLQHQLIYDMQDYATEVVFNMPDYTEFPNTVLHASQNAKRAVRQWLLTGEIPLFYIADRLIVDEHQSWPSCLI